MSVIKSVSACYLEFCVGQRFFSSVVSCAPRRSTKHRAVNIFGDTLLFQENNFADPIGIDRPNNGCKNEDLISVCPLMAQGVPRSSFFVTSRSISKFSLLRIRIRAFWSLLDRTSVV